MHFLPVTVHRGLCIVLTITTGAALFAAEACSGGDNHPPVATEIGDTLPGVNGGGGSANASSGTSNGGSSGGNGGGSSTDDGG